jgi:hypothetical protein
MKMNYTIVTAFYLTTALKHPSKNYIEWIHNFINLKTNCVLFTNQDTEMVDRKSYKYDWNIQYSMDDEKVIHHPDLYRIWNEKINFMYIASNKNYFSTNWFVWIDFGSMRISKVFEKQDFTYSNIFTDLDSKYSYFFRIKNGNQETIQDPKTLIKMIMNILNIDVECINFYLYMK